MADTSRREADKSRRTTAVLASLIVAGLVSLAGAAVYQVRALAGAGHAQLTLDPSLFSGETRQAYLVAQQHPELLAQLHCYCGCEQHEGHKNLLDCYRTTHAAACETCVGEAVLAGQLAESGMPAEQIRKVLKERFGHGG